MNPNDFRMALIRQAEEKRLRDEKARKTRIAHFGDALAASLQDAADEDEGEDAAEAVEAPESPLLAPQAHPAIEVDTEEAEEPYEEPEGAVEEPTLPEDTEVEEAAEEAAADEEADEDEVEDVNEDDEEDVKPTFKKNELWAMMKERGLHEGHSYASIDIKTMTEILGL